MSESSRFRSLEGILAKPPARRQPLRALDTTDPTDPIDPLDDADSGAVPAAGDDTDTTPGLAPDLAAQRAAGASAPTSTPPAGAASGHTSAGRRTRGTPGVARTAAAQPASQTTGGTRRVPFRLAEDLARALTERVANDGTSQAHVVLDAIEAAHTDGNLADLVAAEQRPAGSSGALFTRPALRGAATASVATEIRLDAGTLAVLDDLVASTGANTRTQLIIAALQNHLR